MKIAFYFEDLGIEKDLTNPELGNPGIGGTQFNFVSLVYYFDKILGAKHNWTFLCYRGQSLPPQITSIKLRDKKEIHAHLKDGDFDLFIWKPGYHDEVISLIPQDQKSLAWIHNIPGPDALDLLASKKNIVRLVFAGHEALDILRDHSVILKSTVIFNGFDPGPYIQSAPTPKDPNLVVFLGSLLPAKCFHLLTKAWPDILTIRPNTKLKVIGSGKLYDHSMKLGPYGITEEKYEDLCLQPLLNEEGALHESVEFMGLLGKEKIPILQKASVGVINPHGKSEVCPGSAIEFQACGTPVVAGARWGNLDVIQNRKTGFLIRSHKELVSRIVWLLDHPEKRFEMGEKGRIFVSKKFDQKQTVSRWNTLFNQVISTKKIKSYPLKSNYFYNLKIILHWVGILKFKVGLFKNAPSIYQLIERKKGRS